MALPVVSPDLISSVGKYIVDNDDYDMADSIKHMSEHNPDLHGLLLAISQGSVGEDGPAILYGMVLMYSLLVEQDRSDEISLLVNEEA